MTTTYALRSQTTIYECIVCRACFDEYLLGKPFFAGHIGPCSHFNEVCNQCAVRNDGLCPICDKDIYNHGIDQCVECNVHAPLIECGSCGELVCDTCFESSHPHQASVTDEDAVLESDDSDTDNDSGNETDINSWEGLSSHSSDAE